MRRPVSCALSIAAFCLFCAVGATPAAAQGPLDLRCEKATNPRGVKASQPQLSWVLNPSVMQRAYQVLVASSEEKLKADDGDLWDSGRVISDRQSAAYQGKALSSRQRCYWKVRLWGTHYQATGYSDPANWEMGLLFFGERKETSQQN